MKAIFSFSRVTVGLFFSLLLIVVISCEELSSPDAQKSPPGTVDPLHEKIVHLHQRFDNEHPGRGITDYPGSTIEDIPKSYAKILIAELKRQQLMGLAQITDIGIVSGYWLLEHSDLDADGIVGWGVPVAWDAYGDGTINPANTEYTITTAIVMDALLNWYDYGRGAPKERILSVLKKAVLPYLEVESLSPSGLMPYSLEVSDRQFDTFNPAAYMAGQMQRFSHYLELDFAKKLTAVSDLTVRSLIDNHRISSEGGAWYWDYSIQEDVPNDLPHASYIIHGLLNYEKFGGAFSAEIDLAKTYSHLTEFSDPESGMIRGWPRFWTKLNRPARSYGVGMAMSLLCSRGLNPELITKLTTAVDSYLGLNGSYLKHPKGTEGFPTVVVNEYEAYIYDGLVTCSEHDIESGGDSVIQLNLEINSAGSVDSDEQNSALVPFVGLPGGAKLIPKNAGINDVEIAIKGTKIVVDGIPVDVLDVPDDDTTLVITRSVPDANLELKYYNALGQVEVSKQIDEVSDSTLIYRTGRFFDGKLYVVVYDNVTLSNYLISYSLPREGGDLIPSSVKLPLLIDPAGGTYEMVPPVFLSVSNLGLHLLGGTLSALVNDATLLQESRIENCLRVVEVVDTPNGPAGVCVKIETGERLLNQYLVFAPKEVKNQISEDNLVPWGLAYADGVLTSKDLDAPSDYADMLVFDLERSQQSGWMEYGIDNVEGRVPWSQIYHLNGLLDFLYISDRNESFRRVMARVLPKIRQRLDIEMRHLDTLWLSGGYFTKAFTVDRSKALFAVQTSRLLMLMHRYRTELNNPIILSSYELVRDATAKLDGHIEVLAYSGEIPEWLEAGRPHLRWPKGSAFYYDGTPVPFNHQNEWAYSIIMVDSEDVRETANKIIGYFLERVSLQGELPRNGVWDYWWGVAKDGWEESDGVSINTPNYVGDSIKAWISFRTIDAMAVLSAANSMTTEAKSRILSSISSLAQRGLLYPFSLYEYSKHDGSFYLNKSVALKYSRVTSPWEVQNSAWAYAFLIEDSLISPSEH